MSNAGGAGSLRQAIADACEGGMVTFSVDLPHAVSPDTGAAVCRHVADSTWDCACSAAPGGRLAALAAAWAALRGGAAHQNRVAAACDIVIVTGLVCGRGSDDSDGSQPCPPSIPAVIVVDQHQCYAVKSNCGPELAIAHMGRLSCWPTYLAGRICEGMLRERLAPDSGLRQNVVRGTGTPSVRVHHH